LWIAILLLQVIVDCDHFRQVIVDCDPFASGHCGL
jgi:hypothetical protein